MLFWGLFLVGLLMTALIYFGVVSIKQKYLFLGFLLFCVIFLINYYDLSLIYLGLGKTNRYSLTAYTITTLATVLLIKYSGIRKKILNQYKKCPNLLDNIFFYSLASSPSQEFIFRAFPLAIFMKFGWANIVTYTLFTAFCFSFAHIFLRNYYIVMGTFVMGLVWGYIFFYFPDLLLIAISHTILGIYLLYNRQR